VPRTSLILPVTGRLWVLHGHDFYAHHRRWNPVHPLAKTLGFSSIFARYALDLVPVDARNEMRRSGAKRNDDFVGWNAVLQCTWRRHRRPRA
jgi:hypothetical protein